MGALVALAVADGTAAASPAGAQATVAQLLRRSAAADTLRDYRGTKRLVFYGGDHPREMTLRIIHLRPDRTRTEFLGSERMQGAVRIEIGKDAWRFNPGSGQWRRSLSHEPGAMDLARLLANYTATKERTDRVAGRRCSVVTIKPKRPGNPSRRVWIDADTSLLLKTQFFGASGNLISEATFIDIQFAVPKSVQVRAPKEVAASDEPPPTLGFDPVKPSYLPPGYGIVTSTALSVRGRATCHLQYSDGLGTISLFEERRGPSSEEPAHRGARGERPHGRGPRAFPLALRWEHGDMRFTLIGDVSPAELQEMAASLPGGQNAQPPARGGGD
jgi:negative regulator of sigma E activity